MAETHKIPETTPLETSNICDLLDMFESWERALRSFVDSLSVTISRYSDLLDKAESLIDATKQSEKLLNTDKLTGLCNRRYFSSRLAAEISRAHRCQHPISIALMEIDDFKERVTTLGHRTRDLILKEIGELLSKSVGREEIVARYDESKFAMIVPETDHQGAFKLAERIRKVVATTSFAREAGLDVNLMLSFGISTMFKNISEEALIGRATKVLEQARQEGGNRIRIFPLPNGVIPLQEYNRGAPRAAELEPQGVIQIER